MMAMHSMDKAKIVTCAISYIMSVGRPVGTRELYSHFRVCDIPTFKQITQSQMSSILRQVAKNENRWKLVCLEEASKTGKRENLWGLRL